MKKFKIAQIIALVATAISIIVFYISYQSIDVGFNTNLLQWLGVILAIVAYCFAGFKNTALMVFKIGSSAFKAANFIYKIPLFLGGIALSLAAFLYFPIVPIRIAYKKALKTGELEE